MSLTEADLSRVLDHARQLQDAADQLRAIGRSRGDAVVDALVDWEGWTADTFALRATDDDRELLALANRLDAQAQDWAEVWADTVNLINADRREAAVKAEKESRGAGERFVDTFVGDDSDELVREFEPVRVPRADRGFAPTGGLETYG